jgi:energy-converting hydrogenase A subunit M
MSNKRRQVVLTYNHKTNLHNAEVQEVNLTDLSRESLGIYEFTSEVERAEMAKIGHPVEGVTLMGSVYLSVLLDTIKTHPDRLVLIGFASWLQTFAE